MIVKCTDKNFQAKVVSHVMNDKEMVITVEITAKKPQVGMPTQGMPPGTVRQ
jgi:hypothetical protein